MDILKNISVEQIVSAIILLASFIGAIEVILHREKKFIKDTMKEEIDPIKMELKKNSLNTMKNTICNENIPLSERLSVGKEYIELGGNGAVKIYVHKLEEEFEKRLQKEEKL